MVVTPHRVRGAALEAAPQYVAFAEHPERAIVEVLCRREDRSRFEVMKILEAGTVYAEPVMAWRVVGRWARAGGRDLYAASTELVVEPVDVYVGLTFMSDDELIWQCRYIWGSYTRPLLREQEHFLVPAEAAG